MKSSFASKALLLSSLLSPSLSFANSYPSSNDFLGVRWNCIRPVVAIGVGYARDPRIRAPKTYPIVDVQRDEYYIYGPSHAKTNPAFIDAFIGGEYSFYPNFAWQLGLAYNQIDSYSAEGLFTQGVEPTVQTQYIYNYKIATRQILVEGKLLYTMMGCYHPYVIGGAGTSYNHVYDYSTSVPPEAAVTRTYASKTKSSFAGFVGAGVDMDLSQHTRLGLSYRFSDLGKTSFGPASINDIPVGGNLSRSHLYVDELLLQFSYLF